VFGFHERSAQKQLQKAQNPGWTGIPPLLSALESRAPIRMAAQFQTGGHSLGILSKQLPRYDPSCLYYDPVPQVFMRWLLAKICTKGAW
jgi:hypothetical protein